ncbi:MAG: hypothetical protein GYB66_04260 [Chloroflexi bacterium]|nr:hypothetical protein [Chloroflexota bacterium]
MAQDRAKQLLQQGIAAAKAGNKAQAFQALQQVVKIEPQNETAWLWLSSVARNDQERIFCLRHILEINPNNELAIKGLQAMGISPAPPQQQARAAASPGAPLPTSGAPIVSEDKLTKIQPAIDEFLRTYKPEPYTPLEIEWVFKTNKRYGEAAVRRLRASVYAGAAAAAAAVLVGVVGVGLVVLGGSGDDDEQAAGRATLTPSLTPSTTPTPTEVKYTPVPDDVATSTPVAIPGGLPRGNPLVEPTATQPYPPVRPEMQDALTSFSAGDYDTASELARTARNAQPAHCYQDTYYYDALALARQGGEAQLEEAERVLTDGLNAERDPGFDNTCRNSALLKAALCEVKYQQAAAEDPIDLELINEAIQLCNEAHEQDRALPQPAETLSQIYLTLGDPDSLNRAFGVLDDTINASPRNQGNVVLHLLLADIELARGRPENALVHIETALYVEPTSEEALRKRVVAYLRLAEQAPDDSELAIVRYGTAALHADYYLFYYPDAPAAYTLLAEARLREGNPNLALHNLNRVIETENDVERDILRQAYTLRVEIYLSRRQWEDAFNDLERLVTSLDPDNSRWIALQKDVALRLERYDVAATNLDLMLEDNPDDSELLLEKARLLTYTCRYVNSINCDYRAVSRDLLTDEFLASLGEGTSAQREATSYRLATDFALLIDEDIDEEDTEAVAERTATLEEQLASLQSLLTTRETPEDYYLLGQIYSELGQYENALAAYQWVAYWGSVYEYPLNEDVAQAIEDTQDAIEAAAEEAEES